MMSEEIAVRVKNLSKSFNLPYEKHSTLKSSLLSPISSRRKGNKRHRVLKNLSFEIKKGEFFGIVGRNGGGKSTLLKLLASIYAPEKGSIDIQGKLVPFIELGVGFNPELTGRDNVYLNGALLGFSDREIDEVYDDIVTFAELEPFMNQKLKNYSSGMQVRLAFSVATRSKADILLVDEVLAVGDAAFQRKCYNYFSSLKRDKKTVIFISHDMAAVREYCDRAMLIENGEIVSIGNTDYITEDYTRLFMETSETGKSGNNQGRWGDGSATIKSVKSEVNQEYITIMESVKFSQALENPIFGIRIRSAAGLEVTGTNTKIQGIKIPRIEAGSTHELTWHMPNILSDGKYVIDPAVLHSDGVTVCDWWDDCLEFTNHKPRRLPYSVDANIEINFKK